MRKKLSGLLALLGVFSLVSAGMAGAQQFETGVWYAGPRIWVGELNGAVSIGGEIERGFTEPGKYGPGIISGGAGIDYYSWSFDYPPFGSYDYTVIPVQVFSHYHFIVNSNRRLDPYAGLALVYSHVSASWSGTGVSSGFSASGSATDIAGEGGLRYFVSEKFSVHGQIGFGYGTLGLGARWRF